MFEDISTLLTNPDRFFERRVREPSLREPFLVVLAIAVVSIAASAVTLFVFMRSTPADLQVFFLIGGVVGAVFAAVGPFLSWLLYAIAFQVITYFFGGEGEFRDTFALTGWGFVPRVFAAVLSLVVTVYLTQSMAAPADAAAFASYSSELQNRLAYQAVTAAGVLFTLWSAYIWIPAVQRARNVTRGQAAIAVAIPVVIGILITVGSLAISGAV